VFETRKGVMSICFMRSPLFISISFFRYTLRETDYHWWEDSEEEMVSSIGNKPV